jgi:hypothetical protein
LLIILKVGGCGIQTGGIVRISLGSLNAPEIIQIKGKRNTPATTTSTT